MGWGQFLEGLHAEIWPWLDATSRLYIGNLILAALISLIFLFAIKKLSLKQFFSSSYWSYTLKSYWLHPSAIVDYQIYLINGLIKVMFFAPILGLSFYISKYTVKGLYVLFPDFTTLSGSWFLYFSATVVAFLWDDFLRFFHHYLMHKIPFLWTIHRTHHSADVLTPITLFRIHPLESMIASFRNSLSFGVTAGLFMFLISGQVHFMTVLGVNIFGFVFNLISGNLRHSQIPISFGVLEYIFISPKQHQIHHSNEERHFDKNFGVALSIWDLLFGSFLHSKNEVILKYGVGDMSSVSLAEQFWPWKSSEGKAWVSKEYVKGLKPSGILKMAAILFKTLCLAFLVFKPSEANASSQCERYFYDSEYFVEGRVVTVQALNLSMNMKSEIPGVYTAHVYFPEKAFGRVLTAYFKDYSTEVKFNNIRSPKSSELVGLLASGQLHWFENIEGEPELTLFIDKIWRRDPRLQDESTGKVLSIIDFLAHKKRD